jgi:hypothetical protein
MVEALKVLAPILIMLLAIAIPMVGVRVMAHKLT